VPLPDAGAPDIITFNGSFVEQLTLNSQYSLHAPKKTDLETYSMCLTVINQEKITHPFAKTLIHIEEQVNPGFGVCPEKGCGIGGKGDKMAMLKRRLSERER
jgi:hypothetical protein